MSTSFTQNEVLVPTGVGFKDEFIREHDNWGTLNGILENYQSEKYPTIVSIKLNEDFDEFVKANDYKDMKAYNKATFQGTRVLLRSKPGAVTRIASLMALQQLYESLYFEALGNALRIYMDNLYIYNSDIDLSKLNRRE